MTDKANIRLSELQAALENALRHLPSDPSVSQAQAVEILRSDPGNRNAIVLLAASLRLQGFPQKALGAVAWRIRRQHVINRLGKRVASLRGTAVRARS